MSTIAHLADEGAHELAIDMSMKVLLGCQSHREWPQSTALAAAQTFYLLALKLLQAGSTQRADALLCCLGCTHRLADAILLSSSASSSVVERSPSPSLPAVLTSALPGSLLRQLQKGFSHEGGFWEQTGYHDAAHPFSSYLYVLDKEPSNAVELAVQQILARMAQHGCDVGALKAAEWWAHERGATDAHQLHFDLDESRLGAGPAKYKLSHPSYSTVLYLTESGGPTVVLEQTVSSPPAQAAWLSWPQGNNLLCYHGNLLHGVIPGDPPEQGSCQHRVTLVVAFWGVELKPLPGAPGSGPLRELPSARTLQASFRQTWLEEFALRDDDSLLSERQRGLWQAAAHVNLPWKALSAGQRAQDAKHGEGLAAAVGGMWAQVPLPPLRFFLRSPGEIRQVYQPPDSSYEPHIP